MKQPLPVIPVPPARRWRAFRMKVVPALVFAGTLAAIFLVWHGSVIPPDKNFQAEAGAEIQPGVTRTNLLAIRSGVDAHNGTLLPGNVSLREEADGSNAP